MGCPPYWRWRSQKGAGRPKIDRGLRDLIRRMSQDNPLWGASRIHGELLMLGFKVAQSTVSKYMTRSRRPPSQSWKTFLRNHADAIAAIDLCVVPTVTFDRLFSHSLLLAMGVGSCCGSMSPDIRARSGWARRKRRVSPGGPWGAFLGAAFV